MVATFHTLLLIYSLLACPLRCMGSTCGDYAAEAMETGAGCCCCGHCQQSPAEPTDRDEEPSRSNDCSCGNCLCHGAVRSDDEVIAQPFDGFTEAATVVVFSEIPVNRIAVFERPSEARPPSSGKLLCISKQALLL